MTTINEHEASRLKVYVGTSAIGYYFDEHSPTERDAIRRLVERGRRGEVRLFISDLVRAEVEAAPGPTGPQLVAILNGPPFEYLVETPATRELAAAYLAGGVVPARATADALHLAIAVLAHLDVVASYNLKHLARPKTIAEANTINRARGLGIIDITTPGLVP